MISFFVPCDPPTALHHSKKIVRCGGFSRLADTPELQNTKAFLTTLFRPYAPEKPLDGPLQLTVRIDFPWLKKHSARVRAAGFLWHTSKPDCSNLAKTIEDVLASLRFFENDSRVARLSVRKMYSNSPGISIYIIELENGA